MPDSNKEMEIIIMKETKAQVLEVRDIAEGIFLMRVYSSALADTAMPGQFLHIRVPGQQEYRTEEQKPCREAQAPERPSGDNAPGIIV